MVVEKSGRLVVFENEATAATKTVLLDIRSQVESSHDSGMVGLAFHPQFGVPGSPNRHFLYIYYRFTPQKSLSDPGYCRLSRFHLGSGDERHRPLLGVRPHQPV